MFTDMFDVNSVTILWDILYNSESFTMLSFSLIFSLIKTSFFLAFRMACDFVF